MEEAVVRVLVYAVLIALVVWGVARRRARRASMTPEQRQMEDLTTEVRRLRRNVGRNSRW